jgi:hypothetical protein
MSDLFPIPTDLPPLDFSGFKAMGWYSEWGIGACEGFHVVEQDGVFWWEEDE